jgi:hypothetical protein
MWQMNLKTCWEDDPSFRQELDKTATTNLSFKMQIIRKLVEKISA